MAEKFYGQALGNSSAVRWLVIHYYWVFMPKTLYTWSSFAGKLSRVYVLRTLEQTKHIFFFFELLFEKARLLRFALNVVFVVAFFPKILRPRSNLISGLFWFNLCWFLARLRRWFFYESSLIQIRSTQIISTGCSDSDTDLNSSLTKFKRIKCWFRLNCIQNTS